jgi:Fe-S cluster assembly ATP-binding protein
MGKMFEIKELQASIEGNRILKGLNLSIGKGEVHAIMGPNGSGKSTLAHVIAGREEYEVDGDILFDGESIMDMEPDERAHKGIFLAFQHPLEIPGVSNLQFLQTAINSLRKARGLEELDVLDFQELVEEKSALVNKSSSLLERPVNEGFSGGEKKRNEVFQMAMLEPRFSVMDETDSGLDIDALKDVAAGVNAMRDGERSFLLITHYQRLLNFIVPDRVHIMLDGRIVKSGDKELALELEEKGYGWVEELAGAAREG